MYVVTALSSPEGTAARRNQRTRRGQSIGRAAVAGVVDAGAIVAAAPVAPIAPVAPRRPPGAVRPRPGRTGNDREAERDEADRPDAALGGQPEPRLDQERVGEESGERAGVAQGVQPVAVAVGRIVAPGPHPRGPGRHERRRRRQRECREPDQD
jgi:hypothetical protein